MDEIKVTRVGFPKFWEQAMAEKPEAFEALISLRPVEDAIFAKQVGNPLHKVIRHLSKMASNSLSSLETLLLNGYGNDGMKIARGIFEYSVNIAYLIKHPNELDDYHDFNDIVVWRRLKQYDERYPELVKALPADRRKEIEDKYVAVADRFRGPRGVRYAWCKNSLFKMAKDVGMLDHYHATYSVASGMHHGDITGLLAQAEGNTGDVEVAPSTRWIKAALFAGHRGILSILSMYNGIANHGFDRELDEAKQTFKKCWNA